MGKISVVLVCLAIAVNGEMLGRILNLESVKSGTQVDETLNQFNKIIEKMKPKLPNGLLASQARNMDKYAKTILSLRGWLPDHSCCKCPTNPSSFVFGDKFLRKVAAVLQPLDASLGQPCAGGDMSADFDMALVAIGKIFLDASRSYSLNWEKDECDWIIKLSYLNRALARERISLLETIRYYARNDTIIAGSEFLNLNNLLKEIANVTFKHSVDMVNGVATASECCACEPHVTVNNSEHLLGIFRVLADLDPQLDRWSSCGGLLGIWKADTELFKTFTTIEAALKKAMAVFNGTKRLC